MSLKREIADSVGALRDSAPLIHCITNHVTSGRTADMLLAAGASPIMADSPEESAEVTSAAAALLLNLGTPTPERILAMRLSGAQAERRGIPIIFDPVGAPCSAFRRKSCLDIVGGIRLSAVRGNLSEMAFLAGFTANERGVDSEESGISPIEAANAAAKRLGCVCAVTGAEDVISDGRQAAVIRNGTPLLKRVTGAGCMTSALCAAFSAVSGAFVGAAAGNAFMSVCGEIAAERSSGAGSFYTELFNAAGDMTAEILAERLKIDEC